ncbi:hypothetical protein N7320_01975 [Stutzerimonas stutzeri]|uniref:hypothetical protein n=1 Tax=Stutzerimonas stutzeri TaxID=316 RepID=UPI00244CCB66|nr:hypothetical protein [Stutzerimonas stutzeri]MDH0100082.1 hypothetical protein [Stutzerimonas stutzeri]
MQTVIYVGLRSPARDQAIVEALLDKSVPELAKELKLAPSTVRAAAKRIAAMSTFQLTLKGGGKDIPIGTVAAKSFKRAALGAYRHFSGTFKNLELPSWAITDGTNTISIQDLRNLDIGCASVTDDDEKPAP